MRNKKIIPLCTLAVSALCLLASCGASKFTHDLSGDIKHYEADLNHDGQIKDFVVDGKTYHEKNLTWREAYDALVAQTNDVGTLEKIADNMKISKDEKTKPYRSNLARYEILHQIEELVMSTGAIMPLYNYEDSFMIKEGIYGSYEQDGKVKNKYGMYSSSLGYKFFEGLQMNGRSNFNVCVGSKAQTMDPTKNSTVEAATMLSQVLMGAKRWAPDGTDDKPFNTKLIDGVCKCSKEILSNGCAKWTLEIKHNATQEEPEWHASWQNGTKITADDFIWAWNRSASSSAGTAFSSMFDCIKGYNAWHKVKEPTSYQFYGKDGNGMSGLVKVNDYKFTVELVNDCAYFEELLAFPSFMPLPRHTMTTNTGKKNEAIVDSWWKGTEGSKSDSGTYFCGNGPLKFSKIDNKEGGSIVCVPNSYYEDLFPGQVKVSSLTFSLIDDDSAMLTQYKDSTLQFIDTIAAGSTDDMKKKYPKEFKFADQTALYYFLFNVNDNTFDLACNKGLSQSEQETRREKLRWVLNLLINRNDICTNVGKSGQTPSSGFVSDGVIENCLPIKPTTDGKVPNTTVSVSSGAEWCISLDEKGNVVTSDWQKRNKPFSGFLTFSDNKTNRYNVFADRAEKEREDGLLEGFFPTFSGKNSTGGEIDPKSTEYKNKVNTAQKLYIEKAVQLAKEAGVTVTGNSVENYRFTDFPQVKLTMNTGTGHEQVAEKMQFYYGLFGIKLIVETQEWNSFCAAKRKGDFALARNGWTADYRDPRTYLDICTTENGNNDCQLGKAASDGGFIHYSK